VDVGGDLEVLSFGIIEERERVETTIFQGGSRVFL
jgi:hypothetical protein